VTTGLGVVAVISLASHVLIAHHDQRGLRDDVGGLYLTQGMDPAWMEGWVLGAGVCVVGAELDGLCVGDAGVLDCGVGVAVVGGVRSWATWLRICCRSTVLTSCRLIVANPVMGRVTKLMLPPAKL
jgi:hypothetical protein